MMELPRERDCNVVFRDSLGCELPRGRDCEMPWAPLVFELPRERDCDGTVSFCVPLG